MKESADINTLNLELNSLRNLLGSTTSEEDLRHVLVMRRVTGLTPFLWKEFCDRFPSSHWCAIVLPPQLDDAAVLADVFPDSENMSDSSAKAEAQDAIEAIKNASPQTLSALATLLSRELLHRQLERELHRLSRNGGELTIVCAGIHKANSEKNLNLNENLAKSEQNENSSKVEQINDATVAKTALKTQLEANIIKKDLESDYEIENDAVESAFCEILQQRLENCDSLGSLGGGKVVAILPGYGLLRGRLLAEKVRKVFLAKYAEEMQQPLDAKCAFGIVTIARNNTSAVEDLLQRAMNAFILAKQQEDGIFYDSDSPLSDKVTMVESKEKRFLFFGGE